MAKTTPSDTTGMPSGIPYIISNEVAERFSFYGMKGILSVFMFQYLWLMNDTPGIQMSEATATKHYHDFGTWVYITPFFGALLADIFLGKYRTIIWLSLVYCLGHAALALMGIAGSAGAWLFAGLALICIGGGGIKPCVSAHVGDQFGPNNQNLLTKVFNWFYFSINLGAFTSGLLTPWLLEWYGPHWAFGVPGVLMAIATLCFWLGRNKFVHIPAGEKEFVREILSKEGILAVLKLFPLYILVAFFWSLFDQTGSSWVFQSKDMDRNFLGHEWLPSQIQVANPVLILILVPLFSFVIYPTVGRFITLTPLRKIGAGLFLTVLAFALIAGIQIAIDGGARPNIGWQLFAYLIITAAEVMVSIVCLEYSYTQAPKTMKSLVMAIFFGLSVAAGNFITARINGAIEVKDPTAAFTTVTDGIIVHPGYDEQAGTADDITLTLEEGKISEKQIPSEPVFTEAYELINEWATNNEFRLPNNEEAQTLIKGLTDQWEQPLTYKLRNSLTARLSSPGPDQSAGTQWDLGLIITVPELEDKDESSRKTWLEKRKEELGIEDEATNQNEAPSLKKSIFTGGQTKLEGAAYFWLFTGMMLVAAFIFMPYAWFISRRKNQLTQSTE